MMMMPLRRLPLLALTLMIALASAGPAWSQDAKAGPEMRRLARAGQFDKLFMMLKRDGGLAQDRQVRELMDDLEEHRKHAATHTAERRKAYEEAYKEMRDHVAADNLTDAVFSAIEANGLADDPAAMLKLPAVVKLVDQAEHKAAKAEGEQDWLEALSLYRALELLFDDNVRHKDQISRIERKLRLLRFYAPRTLEKLYAERAAQIKAQRAKERANGNGENGDNGDNADDANAEEQDDEPIKINGETWQQRLKGIERTMLNQTFSRAAHHHIGNPGYKPLLKGSIDALMVMAQLETGSPAPDDAGGGLRDEFPRFKDAERVKKFSNGLARIRKSVDDANSPMNYLQMSSIVDDVVELNNATLELPEEVLVYEMTDGATSQLDDFTSIIWPHDLEQFGRNIDGKFYGVGIQISRRNGRLTVVSPLEGTPAHSAGIRANDIIAEVDGVKTADWTLDQAVRNITGPEGTVVKLGIERPGQQKLLVFPITRAEIIIESVKGWEHKKEGGWNYYIDEKNKIGYVRLTQFIPQTVEGLDEAVTAMQEDKGLNGLIVDLRGNPGGLLSSAIDISDRFVGEGTIVSTVNSANRETRRYVAREDRTYPRVPLVILINQGSASASEIVSGAIQDYQRGLIIGDNSFGKGSVQDLFPIDGRNAALKLTTQYYRLPAGRIIHRKPGADAWGIQPDLPVKMTTTQVAELIRYRQDVDVVRQNGEKPKDGGEIPTADKILSKGLDPQLNAALLVIKTNLVAEHVALARNEGGEAGRNN